MSKRIVISSGDFNGIGPEIILKTLQGLHETPNEVTPVILSSKSVIHFYVRQLNYDLPYHLAADPDDIREEQINILYSYEGENPNPEPGIMTKQSGRCAMKAVEMGIRLCQENQADALVTAPISKEAINLADYHYPGHTEFLAEKTCTKDFMMMLINKSLRVGLATIHIPLSTVAEQISGPAIEKYIRIMHTSLKQDFNVTDPQIAVLGLNPHAGDGGVIGTEEIDIISPAIERLNNNGYCISGPLSGDAFFGTRQYKNYHGVLAMYHDQGLIPFKTLSFGKGVNFTAGLPIIRTSPDHGTAFDIAGQNKADPSSFKQAFTLAAEMAENRKNSEPIV